MDCCLGSDAWALSAICLQHLCWSRWIFWSHCLALVQSCIFKQHSLLTFFDSCNYMVHIGAPHKQAECLKHLDNITNVVGCHTLRTVGDWRLDPPWDETAGLISTWGCRRKAINRSDKHTFQHLLHTSNIWAHPKNCRVLIYFHIFPYISIYFNYPNWFLLTRLHPSKALLPKLVHLEHLTTKAKGLLGTCCAAWLGLLHMRLVVGMPQISKSCNSISSPSC